MKSLRPLRSEKDYEAALAEVERLWGAKAGTPKGDRLDILATLIEAYEAKHYPMDPPEPIEAIKFRMEQQGLTRRDLERVLGSRTRVSEVLNRKRGLIDRHDSQAPRQASDTGGSVDSLGSRTQVPQTGVSMSGLAVARLEPADRAAPCSRPWSARKT